jgi:hypothetical protein
MPCASQENQLMILIQSAYQYVQLGCYSLSALLSAAVYWRPNGVCCVPDHFTARIRRFCNAVGQSLHRGFDDVTQTRAMRRKLRTDEPYETLWLPKTWTGGAGASRRTGTLLSLCPPLQSSHRLCFTSVHCTHACAYAAPCR